MRENAHQRKHRTFQRVLERIHYRLGLTFGDFREGLRNWSFALDKMLSGNRSAWGRGAKAEREKES